MPKPYIDKKNKQVFTLYKSSTRDRFGREVAQNELAEKQQSNIQEEQGEGSDFEDDYDGEYYDDDEYYDEDGEYYDDDEYYEDDYEEEPQPKTQEEKFAKMEKEDLHLIGFKNDGYDYTKHMKPIGGGIFIPAVYDMNELKKHKGGILELVQPSQPTPHLYGLEEISKNYVKNENELKGKIDDDVIEALGEEDGDFEELDDDFILQANGGTLDGLEKEVKETQRRLRQLELLDDDEYDLDEDDLLMNGGGNKNQTPLDKLMEEQLNLALEEYDDDDIGELEKDMAQGTYTTDQFKEVFDEFMDEYAANHKPLHEQIEILKRNDKNIPLTEEEKRAIVERNWEEEEEEEVEVEEEEKEQWDCETILTTYTNIYNHPKLIKETPQIKLSKKTGMPLNVLNQKKRELMLQQQQQMEEEENEEDEEDVRVNLGQSRKNETKEEKKARKKALKEEKREIRGQKKELKQAFKSEEIKQMNVMKSQKLNKLVAIQY